MDVSLKMFSDIPSVVRHHWNAGNLNWPLGIYITLVHVVGFVGVAKLMECSKETLMWAFVLWPIR